MAKPDSIKKAMKVIWEGETEGNKWDDLYEYPYADWEREKIMKLLRATAVKLDKLFSS